MDFNSLWSHDANSCSLTPCTVLIYHLFYRQNFCVWHWTRPFESSKYYIYVCYVHTEYCFIVYTHYKSWDFQKLSKRRSWLLRRNKSYAAYVIIIMPCALEMRVVSSRNFDWEISCNHIGKSLDMAQEQAHIPLCLFSP